MRLTSFVFLLFLFSCDDGKVPADIIAPEKMEILLFDYLSADIYVNEFLSKDSTIKKEDERERFRDAALAKNKTDRKTFDNSYRWYRDHPDLLSAVLDSAMSKKSRELEKMRLKQMKLAQ